MRTCIHGHTGSIMSVDCMTAAYSSDDEHPHGVSEKGMAGIMLHRDRIHLCSVISFTPHLNSIA